ncbi:glycosyltransferase [Galbitalea sp. SE-J8]|uniref:glycosyltransferase family 2 protein n=1 Tax=Galbitalea sp. SE-J8 TaxID=3054952 RepID=UPI00259C912C|nr:glycosyltransferase [Galbitalea sp. SE-J8]MDM4762952.1 glycosyltransferase [Galbitalea sp. SE-J8]
MTAEGRSPLFSVITPVYDPPLDVFRETATSLIEQSFTDWEWVLVDDASPVGTVREELVALAARDPRIRVRTRSSNGGIVAASNDALDEATGEFAVLLDHDDELTPGALEAVAAALAADPAIDYLYSDEAVVEDGIVRGEFRKPDWSPERLRHQMYTSHLSVLRLDLVREVGGFHPDAVGAQDHDLVLRVTERARAIRHLPEVLYHWRVVPGSTADGRDADAKPYAWDAGARAVTASLERVGIDAVVAKGPSRGYYRLLRPSPHGASVSVIIPTMGSRGLVRGDPRYFVVEMVRSLVERSSGLDVEYVVVYDPPTPPRVLDELRAIAGAALTLVPFTERFNFSEKCNAGFVASRGDYVVFLNDDMEAISDDPLGQLVAPLAEESVGMTGARLLFESTRHQHAGIVYGSGTIYPAYYRTAMDHPGAFGDLWVNREVSALTGACMALRRATFEEAGGFSEAFPLNYNDIDLCMKVRSQGRRLVWLQNVILFHFESISRETAVSPDEIRLVQSRWGSMRPRDVYGLTP